MFVLKFFCLNFLKYFNVFKSIFISALDSSIFLKFIFFLFFSIISLTLNYIFKIGNELRLLDYSWSFWITFLWFFLLLFHLFNVYVTNRLISSSWIKNQKYNLIKIQRLKIESLKKEIEIETKIKAESELFNKKPQLVTIIVAAAENNIIGNENK